MNTRVSDPARRRLNRKLDRQKKARRKQSEKMLNASDEGDAFARSSIYLHTKKIGALKEERASLPSLAQGRPGAGGVFRVLRRLEGISYWVLENPAEIGELVCMNIRKEWESDIAEQEDHEDGSWLASLSGRKWKLEVVRLDSVKLSSRIMNYVNPTTGYSFQRRLEERARVLDSDLTKFDAVIRPLVIRAEDRQLMDGYCRYQVLRDRGVSSTYAYLGAA